MTKPQYAVSNTISIGGEAECELCNNSFIVQTELEGCLKVCSVCSEKQMSQSYSSDEDSNSDGNGGEVAPVRML